MAANIEVDVSKLKKAKKSIDEMKKTIETNCKDLNTALETLKEDWQTEAGKKFFKEFKDGWTEYVDMYVKKLQGVSDMLSKAINQYSTFDDEVEKLKVENSEA